MGLYLIASWTKRTSAANKVLISPIAFSMERNGICRRQIKITAKNGITELQITFEKRLFSILWAMDSLRASGSLRSRIALFLIYTRCRKKLGLAPIPNNNTHNKPVELHNQS
jgi:hypothetical protein